MFNPSSPGQSPPPQASPLLPRFAPSFPGLPPPPQASPLRPRPAPSSPVQPPPPQASPLLPRPAPSSPGSPPPPQVTLSGAALQTAHKTPLQKVLKLPLVSFTAGIFVDYWPGPASTFALIVSRETIVIVLCQAQRSPV
ncbi:hypothetical protein Pcinc_018824 [Petrolisthes cinctipes]|uniref:Uncharacterized protein n=1 Tax=Petrolisthes cinctipes TaxID=88211 RepID=A0AAE1FMS8_PETCI|nr:hypothetical protein Pcinc_018824 [Petrolisthes cinctipes]